MNIRFLYFLAFSFVLTTGESVLAEQAPNPRGTNSVVSVQRGETTNSLQTVTRGDISRSTTTNVRRVNNARSVSEQSAGSVVNRSSVKQVAPVNYRSDNGKSVNVRNGGSNKARSATSGNISRAASSRATAVFDDVSKISTGYAACREAYSTCMDQFCAKSSDTYRRCYCSSKITGFRETEAALDQAKILLTQFQSNNLNAIDKTAAEVTAMYSATVGEAAIRNDTSSAANVLSEIGDLLSGKTKVKSSSSSSLTGLSLDFSADLGDIWSNNGSSGFGFDNTSQDLTELEGISLYNAASSQCVELVKDSCENDAVLNMTKSAYNILITQDCNVYEKKIDTQKEAVEKTVREAETILREARLEEYRSHNSADVNACITSVKSALLQDNACGQDYKKCLDYTGRYIDVNTGDPIYSPQLFQMSDLINLNTTTDVISANSSFNKFLDDKKIFAETALDSCRDKSKIVWEEFKRSALIEIAQAQDEKIESIKNSCVSIMKDCYDTQSDALASFDDTTAQATGALNASVARQMCADKVAACAALYAGDGDTQCEFDSNGKLKNTNCGLSSLLAFVQTVDDVKIAEGCEISLTNYITDICTPAITDQAYPYGCRTRSRSELETMLRTRADTYCAGSSSIDEVVTNLLDDIEEEMDYQLDEVCEGLDGFWIDRTNTTGTLLKAFYSNVYGDNENIDWGRCIQNSTMVRCLAYNTNDSTVATYNRNTDECTFTDDWYSVQCGLLGNGYFENGICYVTK